MECKSLKAHFSRYVDLTSSELTLICENYQQKNVAKGEYILRNGEICRFEGFVVSGCFKIYMIDMHGNEKILYFAAEDWWIMEIDSFTNQIGSSLNVQAIEDSAILFITKTAKERLYEELPKVERLFRIMSQKAVVAWQRRLVRNHTMNAEQRYHHFVTSYPDIAMRVTNKQIASYLGITQEFVSKIRKKRLKKK
ncbi:Crp/Fnr family transcriptional regulator [Fulvivirgaceae bacterium BMA12]|uniref:Crp/Fnr family transcriptional regulator n=1 Tax=Agaribacillus aureus TaxID=3051825 RepID=A0ABT8LDL7_9BACT|nr:Crp/Fnr family transcriptional regulator [Fulvivirgaceae bacterium BMA12]